MLKVHIEDTIVGIELMQEAIAHRSSINLLTTEEGKRITDILENTISDLKQEIFLIDSKEKTEKDKSMELKTKRDKFLIWQQQNTHESVLNYK